MFPFSGLIGLPNHEHPIGCLSRGSALITEVKISYSGNDVIIVKQKGCETIKYDTSVKCNLRFKPLKEGISLCLISYLM